jgi:epoxyqueuosine reductase
MHDDAAKREIDKATEYTDALRDLVLSDGLVAFGVADLGSERDCFDGFSRAVSVAALLSRGVLDTIEDGPTKVYAYHYRTINAFLNHTAARVVSYIESSGYRSFQIPASQIADWKDLTGPVSHKEIGRRAGLGFIGRNNLLVTPRFGSRVRLVSVLTDMPLVVGSPIEMDCGECRDCITVCPAGAIGERVEDFDLEKCKEKLKWFKKHLVGHYICGVCVKVCAGPGNL